MSDPSPRHGSATAGDGWGVFGLAQLLGLAAFVATPAALLLDHAGQRGAATGLLATPTLPAFLLTAALVALGLEALTQLGDARRLSLLAVLAAQVAALRFLEVAIPGPGEFSPVFAPILLAGHALGPRFGFQLGALALWVSALITGGLGPWLPYQMMGAGWVGLSAGCLASLVRRYSRARSDAGARTRAGVGGEGRVGRGTWLLLLGQGAFWGLAYGWLMDLWAWSFLEGGRRAGEAAALALARLGAILAGSLAWDLFRAAGNLLLLWLLAPAFLPLLRRAGRSWAGEELTDPTPTSPLASPRTGDRRSPPPAHSPPAFSPPSEPSAPLSSAPLPLPPAPRDPLRPQAWCAWALGLAAAASLSENPWLLVLLGLTAALVRQSLAGYRARDQGRSASPNASRASHSPRAPGGADLPQSPDLSSRPGLPGPSLLRAAGGIIPFAALYSFFFNHLGASVLWRLPAAWPLLGGPLTLESLSYGALTGLRLCLLLAAFATLQGALRQRDLLGLLPRAFGPLSLASGIALAWVPAAGRRLRELREAQIARGIRPPPTRRGALRQSAGLVLPLAADGMERALQLADLLCLRGLVDPAAGLDARGGRLLTGALAALLLGLLGLLTGLLPQALGLAALSGGALLLLALLWRQGRRRPVTRLLPQAWRPADLTVFLGSGLALGVCIALRGSDLVAWSPFPRLAPPPVHLGLLLSQLGLLLPALVLRRGEGAAEARDGQREAAVGLSQLRIGSAPGTPVTADAAAALTGAVSARAGGLAPPIRGPWIRAEGFGLRYPEAAAPVLSGVNLAAGPGSLTLITGPSGAGKSSFLRSLAGLVPWTTGGRTEGRLDVGGLDPRRAGPAAMGRRLGLVPGDPELGFVTDRVADEAALALELAGLPPDQIAQRVAGALAAVDLAPLAWRRLDQLSGGQKQRLAIACALALAPGALALDEPSSQLDDAAAVRLMALLRRLADGGRSLLVTEHRVDRVRPWADQRLELPGAGDAMAAVAGLSAAHPPPTRLAVVDASPSKGGDPAPAPLLSARGLAFGYGAQPLLEGIDLDLWPGQALGLMGPSGVGKTSLLRLLVGLEKPWAGEVRRGPALAQPWSLAYLPQEPGRLLLAATAREELLLGLRAHGLPAAGRHHPDAWLDRLGLTAHARQHPQDLSTGQRQRLALAALLVMGPRLLLLDEPSRGLDDGQVAVLLRLLAQLTGEGMGLLVATHDRRLLPGLGRVVRMEGLGGGGLTAGGLDSDLGG